MTDDPNWPVLPGRASGLELAVGHAAIWHEPGLPTFLQDQPHAYASREVIAAPSVDELDLSAGLTAWQGMRAVSLAMLADAALMSGCAAFEIRYVATPRPPAPVRVQMYLTAKSRDWHQVVAQAAVALACDKLPLGFTWATPEDQLGFGGVAPEDQIVLELRRDEELTSPQWTFIPAEYYYTINDDPGDGSGWPAFWRTLNSVTRPVTVSLLFQQTELHPEERHVLGSVLTDLAHLSEERTDYDVMGNPMVYPACMNARIALQSWERRVDQMRRPLMARLAVRSEVSTAVSVATALTTAVGTSAGVSGTHPMLYEPAQTAADIRQANFSFDWLEILPWGGHGFWAEDPNAPYRLRRMPYLFGLNEAATLALLPVPDQQGVAGIPRARQLVQHRQEILDEPSGAASVLLGPALHHGEAASSMRLPLDALTKHTLIVGASGWGKTTTLLSLLVQLWRDHHIPFLVLEASKTEYRSLLAVEGLDDLRVLTLGNESVSPLRLNPLAPPTGVRCEVHQSALMASLKLALPLFPPQPEILVRAISRAYDRAGWDDDTTLGTGLLPPTLRDLKTAYAEVFEDAGYVGEARNIGIGFKTRLESLLQGSRGKLLDTVFSTNFDTLLSYPVVIEMDEIVDADEKAILSAFILDRVRAGARARGSTGGRLEHVTVLEEAHRLLSKTSASGGDPASGHAARAETVRAFCEAIAELRARGEGFILSTQSPAMLADAAIANTSTRIVHRMENDVDREAMLKDFGASDEIRQTAARLQTGEAVARWPGRDEIELIRVAPVAGVDSGRKVSDDVVAQRMGQHRDATRKLLPYQLCSPEICTAGCSARVRRTGEELGSQLGPRAAELWSGREAAGDDPLGSVSLLLAEKSGKELQVAYCGAVHLSLEGSAFRLRPGVDDRATAIRSVRWAVEHGGA